MYRERAKALRSYKAGMSEETQAQLERIAEDYDLLANTAERRTPLRKS